MEVRRKLRIGGGRRRYGGGERRRVRRMRRGNGFVVVVEAVQRSTVATAAEVQEVAKLHAVRFARKTTTEEFANPMTAATEASAMPMMIPEYFGTVVKHHYPCVILKLNQLQQFILIEKCHYFLSSH